jgi:hypothetical protein
MSCNLVKIFYFKLSSFILCFLIISSLCLSNPVCAVEFNLKLRKTDVNELRKQFITVYDQNIVLINELLICLKQGKTIDYCINNGSQSLNNKEIEIPEARSEQFKKSIKKKITTNNIKSKQIVELLEKFLFDAKTVKRCLISGHTENEIKDCIMSKKRS